VNPRHAPCIRKWRQFVNHCNREDWPEVDGKYMDTIYGYYDVKPYWKR